MLDHQAHQRTRGAEDAVTGSDFASRRALLRGSAKLAGGGALALAFAAAPGRGPRPALAQEEVDVSTPIGVLNYALTLELLENAFYRDGLAGFGAGDFEPGIFDNLAVIGQHEGAHVVTLSDTIVQLGGAPVAEQAYDFGEAFADPAAFLGTAQALENTGVAAYTGAAQFLIDDDALLTAALTIHGVEARHAAYLNRLNRAVPFPNPVDAPLSPDAVMAIATPFIVAAGGGAGTVGAGDPGGAAESTAGETAAADRVGGDGDRDQGAAAGGGDRGGGGRSGAGAASGVQTMPRTGGGGAGVASLDGDRPFAMSHILGLAAAGAGAAAVLVRRRGQVPANLQAR